MARQPPWKVRVRGGAYDGWNAVSPRDPQPILVMWRCSTSCDGHGTFDPLNPDIVLDTAEAYRRVELDASQRFAVYEIADADDSPQIAGESRELAGAGAGRGLLEEAWL